MFQWSALSMTIKVVAVLSTLLVLVGPYLGLWYYVPKYHETVGLLKDSKNLASKLTGDVATLEGIKVTYEAATQALKAEKNNADDRRRAAESQAQTVISANNKRIANLSAKLSLLQLREKAKEPVNADQECADLKNFIDDYTVVPSIVPNSKPVS